MPTDYPQAPPPPHCDGGFDHEVQRSIGWEQAQFQHIERLVDHLAAEVAQSGLWRIGDGYGGWIHNLVDEYAEKHGLELTPPRSARSKSTRKNVPMDVRAFVFARDGLVCVDCGASDDLTVDHIVAVINGGGNEPENLATRCRSCNSKKGAR